MEIDAPNAPPRIETVDIGRLRWRAEQQDVTGLSLGPLIKEYSHRGNPELTVLRLTLGRCDGPAEPTPGSMSSGES